MFRRSWRTKMTASEAQRGLVFFLLYLFVFPRLNAWVQRLIIGDGEGEVLVAEANVIYYGFLFILALFIFWIVMLCHIYSCQIFIIYIYLFT